MSEMIERVAKAIYEADGGKGWHIHSAFYLKAARSGIEAMREPTEDMVYSGMDKVDGETFRDVETAFTAMIDEALK